MGSNMWSLLIFFFRWRLGECGEIPAMYVMGDSLVDVGNNNYLKPPAPTADFYPYGIDFPTRKPTGRFCNGLNAADFIAEKVGLPAAPPYFSIKNQNYTSTGLNFGSGGSGIISQTENKFKSIALNQQVNFYASVFQTLEKNLGRKEAKARVSKSLFLIEIGSNDLFGYFGSPHLLKAFTPQKYAEFLSTKFEEQLKRLYINGARKLVVVGIGAIGCTPAMRYLNHSEECNSELNALSSAFNQQLLLVLKRLKSQLLGFHYSYFDGFSVMLTSIHKPSSFGFREVKAACCGGGRLRAGIGCNAKASYCSNREEHLFWDAYHPTQKAHRVFSNLIFNGPKTYAFPLNLQELLAI